MRPAPSIAWAGVGDREHEKLAHGQDRYLSERVVPLPRGVPARLLPAWWLDSGSRPKPDAWAQPFPRQAPNLAGSDQETFKLMNFSRRPALELEEPLQDDRVALGPVRLWGLCAGGSGSGSFPDHGKGPSTWAGPTRNVLLAARKQGNARTYPSHTTPRGAPPRPQVCTRLDAGRGRRGTRRCLWCGRPRVAPILAQTSTPRTR
jgi:hypothetical protein